MNEPRHQIPLVLSAVGLAYLGQMTLSPIIAPLAREVGLAEWQIGFTISMAAIMVVTTSQWWGRRSVVWGRKPVLVGALGAAFASMALFAVVSWLGMNQMLAGSLVFVLFVALRGVGYGGAIAAIPPTAQAYIASATSSERERVKGMAAMGAVQSIAMIVGAVVGGGLAGFGLMTPLVVVPSVIGAAVLLVMVRLRPQQQTELIPNPPRIKLSDSRVWPFLVAGFGMFTALGLVQITAGFLIQDRFKLSAEMTGVVTGGTLLAAGLGMIVAQAVIVPRSGWHPVTLLRVGTAVGLVGFLALIPNAGMPLLVLAMALMGLGLGIGTPGYTAGPTLDMRHDEQGGLAGLVGAINGLTFVIAPTAGTAMYGWHPVLPLAGSALIMAIILAFVWLHPRLRAALVIARTEPEEAVVGAK